MAAPVKPCAQVHSEFQPKLTTKSGMASGMTTSTAQTRRPGRSVRSTHHAAAVPITAQATVTTAREPDRVPQQGPGQRAEDQALQLAGPGPGRLDQQEDQRDRHERGHCGGGGEQRHRAGRPPSRPLVPVGVLDVRQQGHSRPAWRSRSIAAAPSPSWAIVIGLGCSWLNGVSGAEMVTPDPIGYS